MSKKTKRVMKNHIKYGAIAIMWWSFILFVAKVMLDYFILG